METLQTSIEVDDEDERDVLGMLDVKDEERSIYSLCVKVFERGTFLSGIVVPDRDIEYIKHLTDAAQLSSLAGDPDIGVRVRVAANPNTPTDALDLIASHQDFTSNMELVVRRCVAGNPNTATSLLDTLAHDEFGYVRLAVAKNPAADAGTLAGLAEDDAEIAEAAQATLSAKCVRL